MEDATTIDQQEENVLGLPLEMWARVANHLPPRDFLNFSQAHTDLMAAAKASRPHNSPALIQMLSDKLVDLLRGDTTRLAGDQVESIWRLHQFYLLCGGKAPLSLMKQKADELNKRAAREKALDKVSDETGTATLGLFSWTATSWGVFGCCCASNPCCCALSIVTSVLCCGSFTLNQVSRYEKNNYALRSRFCDVNYDLEAHRGNDFHAVVPANIQMDELQPMPLEQNERPSCFAGLANFFRTRADNNPDQENIELVARFEN